MEKKLVLIDSHAIIHRAYHALPKNMSTSKGELTNAVYGFATTLIKVLEDIKPTHIAASFDVSAPTFRIAEYAQYKATRVKADQELYDQIPKVHELLDVLNIPVYECEGHEADDCIGTIVDKLQIPNSKLQINEEISNSQNIEIFIVTGDKDLFQLLNGQVFVYWLKKGLSLAEVVDRAVIKKEFNLDPEDFIDLKALAGDSSDNIPGVPGIGPKTATDLLQKFDTLVKLYEQLESRIKNHELGVEQKTNDSLLIIPDSAAEEIAKDLDLKPRIIKLLLQYRDQAFLSQKLATIKRDVPMDFDLDKCEWGKYDREKLREFFERMQFHSLLKRFGAERGEEPKTKQAKEQKGKDEQLRLL